MAEHNQPHHPDYDEIRRLEAEVFGPDPVVVAEASERAAAAEREAAAQRDRNAAAAELRAAERAEQAAAAERARVAQAAEDLERAAQIKAVGGTPRLRCRACGNNWPRNGVRCNHCGGEEWWADDN